MCDASTLTGIAGRHVVESIDGPFTIEIPGIAALSDADRAELTRLLLLAVGKSDPEG